MQSTDQDLAQEWLDEQLAAGRTQAEIALLLGKGIGQPMVSRGPRRSPTLRKAIERYIANLRQEGNKENKVPEEIEFQEPPQGNSLSSAESQASPVAGPDILESELGIGESAVKKAVIGDVNAPEPSSRSALLSSECGRYSIDLISLAALVEDVRAVSPAEKIVSHVQEAPPEELSYDESVSWAIACVSGVPVLAHSSRDGALEAAETILRSGGHRVDVLNPPPGLYGDALELFWTRGEASYVDEGARRVAFALPDEKFGNWAAEELRYGVSPEARMSRYAVSTHDGRPLRIGVRQANVASLETLDDEVWFFGSEGFVDDEGLWRPSRGEILHMRRRLQAMNGAFRDAAEGTPWAAHLDRVLAAVEITLLSRRYGITFEEEAAGEREWSPSTRMARHEDARHDRIALDTMTLNRLFLRRRLFATLTWLPRLPGRVIGGTVRRLVFKLRRRLARYGPYEPVDLADEARGFWRPRVEEGFWPSLYDPRARQTLTSRLFRFLFYRHVRLNGAVSGERDWQVQDPPWSEEFRRRFRPHEFDPDFSPRSMGFNVVARPRRRGLVRKMLLARRLRRAHRIRSQM